MKGHKKAKKQRAKLKPGRKPDPASKRSRGVDRHTGRRVVFFMDHQDYADLSRHVASRDDGVKLSAVLRFAVSQYLTRHGGA